MDWRRHGMQQSFCLECHEQDPFHSSLGHLWRFGACMKKQKHVSRPLLLTFFTFHVPHVKLQKCGDFKRHLDVFSHILWCGMELLF